MVIPFWLARRQRAHPPRGAGIPTWLVGRPEVEHLRHSGRHIAISTHAGCVSVTAQRVFPFLRPVAVSRAAQFISRHLRRAMFSQLVLQRICAVRLRVDSDHRHRRSEGDRSKSERRCCCRPEFGLPGSADKEDLLYGRFYVSPFSRASRLSGRSWTKSVRSTPYSSSVFVPHSMRLAARRRPARFLQTCRRPDARVNTVRVRPRTQLLNERSEPGCQLRFEVQPN